VIADILLGLAGLAFVISVGLRNVGKSSIPIWGWFWVTVILGGLASVGVGLHKASKAGSQARQAGQLAGRIMDQYGQSDQSASLRTCLRLALDGKDCEGGDKDTLPRKGARAEKCGYSEDKCMSSEELNAFGKCMRGDNL